MTDKQKDLLREISGAFRGPAVLMREILATEGGLDCSDAIEAALKEVEAFDLLVKDAAQDHRDGRISPGYYAALIALAENARTPNEPNEVA